MQHTTQAEELEIHNDTIALACLTDRTYAAVLDIAPTCGAVLQWRRTSINLLVDLLRRLGEAESIELPHAEFAFTLWPNVKEASGLRRLRRALDSLKMDQRLSNFPAVRIQAGKRVEKKSGGFDYFPTVYRRGAYYSFLSGFQDKAIEGDLMSLPLSQRRARLRTLVESVLLAQGCVPIGNSAERKKKERAVGDEKDATCTHECSIHPAIIADENAWNWRRLPYAKRIEYVLDFLEMELGGLVDEASDYKEAVHIVSKAYTAMQRVELGPVDNLRLRIMKANKRG